MENTDEGNPWARLDAESRAMFPHRSYEQLLYLIRLSPALEDLQQVGKEAKESLEAKKITPTQADFLRQEYVIRANTLKGES